MSHNSLGIEEEINGPETMANSSPGLCLLLVFANLILLFPNLNKSNENWARARLF